MYFENWNTTSIVTPVNYLTLANLLRRAKYDPEETKFLVEGFRDGFDIGYEGPLKGKDLSSNIPLKLGTKTNLWNKVKQEVKLGRFAGPYKKIPFKYYIQSPIGLVPKNNGKFRLIFHLSYSFDRFESINHYIPDERCTVKYNDLDMAICYSLNLGNENKPIFYGSTNLLSAFRILLTKPIQRFLMILKAEDPITGKTMFFVDKNLAMGSSISCSHFQHFSNGLRHVVEYVAGVKTRIINYLDDYIFLDLSKVKCFFIMKKFEWVCKKIGVPIAHGKTVWPTNRIVFLGILLMGDIRLLGVPLEKKEKALKILSYLLDKKKATVKEIESLAGLLNFLGRAIFPGRAFTRRM